VGSGRKAGIVVAFAVSLPVGLILLAKLFHSDALGWMFGLTLMFALALLPCGAILALGFAAGSLVHRRDGGPATSAALRMHGDALTGTAASWSLRIDRDSVHASDEPRAETIELAPGTTWLELLNLVRRRRYLPDIRGGQASWVAELRGGAAPVPIGVCAQQWPAPRLLVAGDAAQARPSDAHLTLHFRYLCQQDPDVVFTREIERGSA